MVSIRISLFLLLLALKISCETAPKTDGYNNSDRADSAGGSFNPSELGTATGGNYNNSADIFENTPDKLNNKASSSDERSAPGRGLQSIPQKLNGTAGQSLPQTNFSYGYNNGGSDNDSGGTIDTSQELDNIQPELSSDDGKGFEIPSEDNPTNDLPQNASNILGGIVNGSGGLSGLSQYFQNLYQFSSSADKDTDNSVSDNNKSDSNSSSFSFTDGNQTDDNLYEGLPQDASHIIGDTINDSNGIVGLSQDQNVSQMYNGSDGKSSEIILPQNNNKSDSYSTSFSYSVGNQSDNNLSYDLPQNVSHIFDAITNGSSGTFGVSQELQNLSQQINGAAGMGFQVPEQQNKSSSYSFSYSVGNQSGDNFSYELPQNASNIFDAVSNTSGGFFGLGGFGNLPEKFSGAAGKGFKIPEPQSSFNDNANKSGSYSTSFSFTAGNDSDDNISSSLAQNASNILDAVTNGNGGMFGFSQNVQKLPQQVNDVAEKGSEILKPLNNLSGNNNSGAYSSSFSFTVGNESDDNISSSLAQNASNIFNALANGNGGMFGFSQSVQKLPQQVSGAAENGSEILKPLNNLSGNNNSGAYSSSFSFTAGNESDDGISSSLTQNASNILDALANGNGGTFGFSQSVQNLPQQFSGAAEKSSGILNPLNNLSGNNNSGASSSSFSFSVGNQSDDNSSYGLPQNATNMFGAIANGGGGLLGFNQDLQNLPQKLNGAAETKQSQNSFSDNNNGSYSTSFSFSFGNQSDDNLSGGLGQNASNILGAITNGSSGMFGFSPGLQNLPQKFSGAVGNGLETQSPNSFSNNNKNGSYSTSFAFTVGNQSDDNLSYGLPQNISHILDTIPNGYGGMLDLSQDLQNLPQMFDSSNTNGSYSTSFSFTVGNQSDSNLSNVLPENTSNIFGAIPFASDILNLSQGFQNLPQNLSGNAKKGFQIPQPQNSFDDNSNNSNSYSTSYSFTLGNQSNGGLPYNLPQNASHIAIAGAIANASSGIHDLSQYLQNLHQNISGDVEKGSGIQEAENSSSNNNKNGSYSTSFSFTVGNQTDNNSSDLLQNFTQVVGAVANGSGDIFGISQGFQNLPQMIIGGAGNGLGKLKSQNNFNDNYNKNSGYSTSFSFSVGNQSGDSLPNGLADNVSRVVSAIGSGIGGIFGGDNSGGGGYFGIGQSFQNPFQKFSDVGLDNGGGNLSRLPQTLNGAAEKDIGILQPQNNFSDKYNKGGGYSSSFSFNVGNQSDDSLTNGVSENISRVLGAVSSGIGGILGSSNRGGGGYLGPSQGFQNPFQQFSGASGNGFGMVPPQNYLSDGYNNNGSYSTSFSYTVPNAGAGGNSMLPQNNFNGGFVKGGSDYGSGGMYGPSQSLQNMPQNKFNSNYNTGNGYSSSFSFSTGNQSSDSLPNGLSQNVSQVLSAMDSGSGGMFGGGNNGGGGYFDPSQGFQNLFQNFTGGSGNGFGMVPPENYVSNGYNSNGSYGTSFAFTVPSGGAGRNSMLPQNNFSSGFGNGGSDYGSGGMFGPSQSLQAMPQNSFNSNYNNGNGYSSSYSFGTGNQSGDSLPNDLSQNVSQALSAIGSGSGGMFGGGNSGGGGYFDPSQGFQNLFQKFTGGSGNGFGMVSPQNHVSNGYNNNDSYGTSFAFTFPSGGAGGNNMLPQNNFSSGFVNGGSGNGNGGNFGLSQGTQNLPHMFSGNAGKDFGILQPQNNYNSNYNNGNGYSTSFSYSVGNQNGNIPPNGISQNVSQVLGAIGSGSGGMFGGSNSGGGGYFDPSQGFQNLFQRFTGASGNGFGMLPPQNYVSNSYNNNGSYGTSFAFTVPNGGAGGNNGYLQLSRNPNGAPGQGLGVASQTNFNDGYNKGAIGNGNGVVFGISQGLPNLPQNLGGALTQGFGRLVPQNNFNYGYNNGGNVNGNGGTFGSSQSQGMGTFVPQTNFNSGYNNGRSGDVNSGIFGPVGGFQNIQNPIGATGQVLGTLIPQTNFNNGYNNGGGSGQGFQNPSAAGGQSFGIPLSQTNFNGGFNNGGSGNGNGGMFSSGQVLQNWPQNSVNVAGQGMGIRVPQANFVGGYNNAGSGIGNGVIFGSGQGFQHLSQNSLGAGQGMGIRVPQTNFNDGYNNGGTATGNGGMFGSWQGVQNLPQNSGKAAGQGLGMRVPQTNFNSGYNNAGSGFGNSGMYGPSQGLQNIQQYPNGATGQGMGMRVPQSTFNGGFNSGSGGYGNGGMFGPGRGFQNLPQNSGGASGQGLGIRAPQTNFNGGYNNGGSNNGFFGLGQGQYAPQVFNGGAGNFFGNLLPQNNFNNGFNNGGGRRQWWNFWS